MEISKREKRILMLAGAVALLFVITSIFPMVRGVYQNRQENIEDIQLDMVRETRLIENTARWRERRVMAESRQSLLEEQIFSGATIPIVEANIQTALSQHARDSGITVNSTRLAERLETEGWLLISQEMSFNTNDASNTIGFLQKLERSAPRLRVTDFSINRSRSRYAGSITVVGFARSQGLLGGTADER